MSKNTSTKEKKADNTTEEHTKLTEAVDVEALQQELADAQTSAKESYDKLVRLQAEVENLRRRNAKDIENAHKFALEKFAKELLETVDSLSMGMKSAQEEGATIESLKEGLEMTAKLLSATLEKFAIIEINPAGEMLNPEKHEAITIIPMEGKESNEIIEVVQIGYELNDRVLRPAMVVVAQ